MGTKSFFQFYSAKAGHDAVIKMKGYKHDKTGKIVKVGA